MRLFVLVLIASCSLVGPCSWARWPWRRMPAVPRPGGARARNRPLATVPAPSPSTASSSAWPKPKTRREAQGIAGLIERRWARSGLRYGGPAAEQGVAGRREERSRPRRRTSRPRDHAPAQLGLGLVHAGDRFLPARRSGRRDGGSQSRPEARASPLRRLGRPWPDLPGGGRQGAGARGFSPARSRSIPKSRAFNPSSTSSGMRSTGWILLSPADEGPSHHRGRPCGASGIAAPSLRRSMRG